MDKNGDGLRWNFSASNYRLNKKRKHTDIISILSMVVLAFIIVIMVLVTTNTRLGVLIVQRVIGG